MLIVNLLILFFKRMLDNIKIILSNRTKRKGMDMYRNKEVWVGVILTALLGMALLFVHGRSVRPHEDNHFYLYAYFSKADGLMNGAEVRMAGMPIGKVITQSLADDYLVRVKIAFNRSFLIPLDSSISIETDGLLGSKHLEIFPGGDENMLESGDTIEYTQDSLILSELLEKVNVYMKNKKEKEATHQPVAER